MTIEEILHCSAEQLEKMTDKELLSYFGPCLQFTHVDKVIKKEQTKKVVSTVAKQQKAKVNSMVQAILSLHGKQN
jgi:hypothetical protein